MKVSALAGGVGGAKLLRGLQRALTPGDLTAVVNTGDDDRIYGLHVAPDLDIVTYWLAGRADTQRGWGLAGDTFRVVDALGDLGAENWFRLGDVDLATCLYRTERMEAGARLSEVTDEIRSAFDVPTRILPMTDDPLATKVRSADGRTLSFQEYFVRERTEPEVVELIYEGAGSASAAPGVIGALEGSDVIVVCPSNPVLSIAPILALKGLPEMLQAHPRVVAVSPIVGGVALKGPADRLLRSLGHDASASSVARLYSDFCDVFVVDQTDAGEVDTIERLGCRAVALDTVMVDERASESLARSIMSL